MADTILQNESSAEKPADTIQRLAGDIQMLARRVAALAMAVDSEIDYTEPDDVKRHAIGRAVSLIQVIEETATRLETMGEQVESSLIDLTTSSR